MFSKCIIASVLAHALAGGLAAQCGTNLGNPYSRLFGNSWMGGYVRAGADVDSDRYTTYDQVELNLGLLASVKLLQHNLDVLDLGYRAYHMASKTSTFHFPSDNLRVRFIGLTFWNGSALRLPNSTTALYPAVGIPLEVFPVDPEYPIPVGPFVLTIRGNAGVIVYFGGSVTMPPSEPRAILDPYAGCYLFGRAGVGVGVPGFNAGVELEGRFANQTVYGRLQADARTCSFSSSLNYTLTAIRLKLKAYVDAFWTRIASTTLIDWSAGSLSWSLF